MLRVAVFIDAGYLWKQLSKALVPEDIKYRRSNVKINYSNFHALLTKYIKTTFPDIPLLRCYWYDGSLPEGNLSSEHNKVASLNDFKLRLGSRAIEDSDGIRKQKGVDGLIIADLIGLAQNKSISHALLISGDGDMVPGVDVAQALGVRIHLLAVHVEEATAPQLKMEADFFDIWESDKINEFAKARPFDEHGICTKNEVNERPYPKRPVLRIARERPVPSDHIILPPVLPPETPHLEQLQRTGIFSRNAELANDFFSALSQDDQHSINQTSIPYDIDKRLLRFGYESKGEKLTEEEKRELRKFVKELSRQPQQQK